MLSYFVLIGTYFILPWTVIFICKQIKLPKNFSLLILKMGDSKNIFQYVQFKSVVNTNFWYKLATEKIDVDKLNDSAKLLYGVYSNFNSTSCIMEIDCQSFNK